MMQKKVVGSGTVLVAAAAMTAVALGACVGSESTGTGSGTDSGSTSDSGSSSGTSDGSSGSDSGGSSSGGGGDAQARSDAPAIDAAADSADAAPANIVYVSTVSGVDTNDGLTPTTPKKTIAAGIVAAGALTMGEVHVCKGVYAESGLALNAAVSLKGGYDCVHWTRTATYGYPTFDTVNESVIQNGNYGAQIATLMVSGTVPSSVVIDGFTVQGASAAMAAGAPTVGIAIQDTAQPKLSNCNVTGGGGTQTGAASAGSIGLSVSGSASPEVTMDTISGGTGTAGTSTADYYAGSAGVVLAGTGTPNLHDFTSTGGAATAGLSLGLLSGLSLTQAQGNALTRATVNGADFAVTPISTSYGIAFTETASGDVIDCDVYGNSLPSATAGTTSEGILTATGDLLLSGDRIYGGSDGSESYGVYAGGNLHMDNSIVHGGEGNFGAGVAAGATMILQFDTIYTPHGSPATVSGVDQFGGTAQMSNVLLIDNGAGAITAGNCLDNPPASFTSLDHTIFGGVQQVVSCTGPSGTEIGGVASLVSSYPGDNSLTSAMCGLNCASALFASWNTNDDGLAALFSTTTTTDGGVVQKGWTFVASPPCIIATGGAPISGITTDINGTTRSSSSPTVGAVEFVGTCAP